MKVCSNCRQELADEARFCTRCGRYVYGEPGAGAAPEPPPGTPAAAGPASEEMWMPALYIMVGALVLAAVFPPWEAPGDPPRFLGFHFFRDAPEPGAIVSRLLITIEMTTIAIAGFYFSWLFRKKR